MLAALALWTGAHAQSPTQASPASASPPTEFRSSFEGYQAHTEEKIINWKEANDRVGRIGGWRAYAKEAQQPSGGSAPPVAKPADPHAGRSKPAQAKP
ncbi:MAG: hypothetical protein H7238_15170 [Polaromonas sp.]|nr:hypothetical protein [Polaromonas sp.]